MSALTAVGETGVVRPSATSSACGPPRGAFPSVPSIDLWDTLSTPGPMARTRSVSTSWARPFREPGVPADLRGLRIARAPASAPASAAASRTLRAHDFDLGLGELLDAHPGRLKASVGWNIRLSPADLGRTWAGPGPSEHGCTWPPTPSSRATTSCKRRPRRPRPVRPCGLHCLRAAGQICGRPRVETTVLCVGAAFEAAAGYGRFRPLLLGRTRSPPARRQARCRAVPCQYRAGASGRARAGLTDGR